MSSERRQRARKTIAGVTARAAGTRTWQTNLTTGQIKASQSAQEVMALPVRVVEPAQDMDPASATFGEFFWMLDYDPPISE